MRRLREQARTDDFTHAQKSVLLLLERDGPATVSALARAVHVKPQSMRVTVASLEQAGAVVGRPDPADGRQTLMALTTAFRKTLASSRAAKEDWLVHVLEKRLSTHEQQQLATAVELLQRLADR